MALTIREKATSKVVATGEPGEKARIFEGNWYFEPDAVNMEHLKITSRIYTCPYKGQCFWIDYDSPEGRAQNVGWVYQNPKSGYEFIKDRIGFYSRSSAELLAEKE